MTFPDSPITPELLVSGAVGISEVIADGLDVYWAENRPSEGGRTAIVRWRDGDIEEITGPATNVRTRVHEYGGGAWWVADGCLVYSDDARGGELFLLVVDEVDPQPRQLTTAGHRYADGRFAADGAWYVCVRERHETLDGEPVVENDVVAIATDGSEVRCITAGRDFYSSPRIAADGRIVVVSWDHPDMPWDFTRLEAATLDDDPSQRWVGSLTGGTDSVVLPDFTSDGRLLAVSDVYEGWWNLVEQDPESGLARPVEVGEFEIATPGWVFGLSRWVEVPTGIVFVAGTPEGDEIRFPNGVVEKRHTSVSSIRALSDGRVAYAASSFAEESAVWVHDGSEATRISTPRDLGLEPDWFPPPELLTFDVTNVDPSAAPGTVAHALFYEPATPLPSPESDRSRSRPTQEAPEPGARDKPALLVMVHGGPTAAARRQLSLAIRFWTSRGVAVADVDYRGSTLYGRGYRHALWGGWGVTDVVDCVAAARHLSESGRVDPERMVIAGGSAGGLTVLNALAHHDVFTGGISRYGVTDLSALATDTHKFESRYLDRLVGEWPIDESIYRDRSPVTHARKIAVPMLVLQGDEDKVVPPSQSEAIVEALEARSVPVRYIVLEGEGHGFRSADAIVAALEAEEVFVDSL